MKLVKLLLPLPLILSVLLLLSTAGITKAQLFGGNPPSITWQQVNTPAARVIFPKGLDSAGIRIADIVGQMNKAIQPTIGFKQLQVSILVQNQTTISNAYVGLAPFRSEFYFTPDQNSFELGSLPWIDQLAVHEFRHVQQYNNFNVGLSKAMHMLFGEGGQAVANSLAIPNWFFEGDAVFNETYVTTQGRGRLPWFFGGYRALWAAGKDYSWMKLRNGSYQDFVPDHYPLGYMMVAYGRDTYGDDFWKNVTQNAASYKSLFFPMQHAIKQYSDKDFYQFGKDALDHFKAQYGLNTDNGNPAKSITPSFNKSINKNQHFIADEQYPAFIDDNTIVYVRSSFDLPPAFYIRTGNAEHRIRVHDYSLDDYFSYRDGKIVYASYRTDPRWGYRTYSELNILDIKTGKQTRITKNSKYFSPAFSEDGTRIVTVQQSTDGKSQLIVLGTVGKVISSIPNPDYLVYTYPKFYGNSIISAVRNTAGQMSIAKSDINTGANTYLLPFTMQPIAFPVVDKDKVYFSATSDKNNDLFALSLTDKKLYQLQSDSLKASIGNYQPAVAAHKLAWTSFTAYGYKLHQADSSQVEWQPLSSNTLPGTLPDYGINALNKGNAVDFLASVKGEEPPVTKYDKAFHLINFHSLILNVSDPNYGFAIEGENVLNTLQSELLFNYNRNEGYKQFGFDAVYGALYPYLSMGANYLLDRTGLYTSKNSLFSYYYNETQVFGGLQFPFNLTRGRTATFLSFGGQVVYNSDNFQSPYNQLFRDQSYMYTDYFLNFSSLSRQAKKNIYPHFGQSISVDYRTAITNISGNQFLAVANQYLPGLAVNHNLVIQGAYQQRDFNDEAGFTNNFPTARGYTSANLYQMYKLSANYHFPIVYPDAGVANSVYFLRIRGNLFYDYSYASDAKYIQAYTGTNTATFRSTGTEVFFDTQLFNQYPVSIGLRYSRLLDNDIFGGSSPNRFEIVLPLSIF